MFDAWKDYHIAIAIRYDTKNSACWEQQLSVHNSSGGGAEAPPPDHVIEYRRITVLHSKLCFWGHFLYLIFKCRKLWAAPPVFMLAHRSIIFSTMTKAKAPCGHLFQTFTFVYKPALTLEVKYISSLNVNNVTLSS